MAKSKLDEEIIKDLKAQREEYSILAENSEKQGIENLSHEESEDYGYFRGKISIIDDMLGKYSD